MKLLIAFLLFSTAAYAQVMQNPDNSLFSDYKASKVGDAVTVIVTEQTSASKSASTSTSRQSTVSGSLMPTVGTTTLPTGGMQLGTTNQFQGNGSASEDGNVQTIISARVVNVDQYGNLDIQGSRLISINGQSQTLQLSGYVRPSDIQPDNTVYSYQIADAKIVFKGSGSIEDSQSPSLLMKIFHWLF